MPRMMQILQHRVRGIYFPVQWRISYAGVNTVIPVTTLSKKDPIQVKGVEKQQ
jgi:hypothetical protein